MRPNTALQVFDPEFPVDRWQLTGVRADGTIEAVRVFPADGRRTSWSPSSWANAWAHGYLTAGENA
jgi:hypothetical protein